MTRVALCPGLGLATLLAACSPGPRSTSYFDAHPAEIDTILAACAAGAHRGAECNNAGLAKAHRDADARMALYKKSF
jgi:hypothetical protein